MSDQYVADDRIKFMRELEREINLRINELEAKRDDRWEVVRNGLLLGNAAYMMAGEAAKLKKKASDGY